MAQAIGCDLCQQEPAEMMQTALANGGTIAVGSQCMITFFAGGLAGMLGQLSETELDAARPALTGLVDIIGLMPDDETPPGWPATLDTPHTEHDTGRREDGDVSMPDDHQAQESLDDPGNAAR